MEGLSEAKIYERLYVSKQVVMILTKGQVVELGVRSQIVNIVLRYARDPAYGAWLWKRS